MSTTAPIIDFGAPPHNPYPSKWEVNTHNRGPRVNYDPAQVGSYLSPAQERDEQIPGGEYSNHISFSFAEHSFANISLLDHFFNHFDDAPEWMKQQEQRFHAWGTLFLCTADQHLHVPALYWEGTRFVWLHHDLQFRFRKRDVALTYRLG